MGRNGERLSIRLFRSVATDAAAKSVQTSIAGVLDAGRRDFGGAGAGDGIAAAIDVTKGLPRVRHAEISNFNDCCRRSRAPDE